MEAQQTKMILFVTAQVLVTALVVQAQGRNNGGKNSGSIGGSYGGFGVKFQFGFNNIGNLLNAEKDNSSQEVDIGPKYRTVKYATCDDVAPCTNASCCVSDSVNEEEYKIVTVLQYCKPLPDKGDLCNMFCIPGANLTFQPVCSKTCQCKAPYVCNYKTIGGQRYGPFCQDVTEL